MLTSRTLLRATTVLAFFASTGCKSRPSSDEDPSLVGSASASAAPSAGPQGNAAKEAAEKNAALPAQAAVLAVTNPGNLPPYAGPTGRVTGIVRVDGDPSPDTPAAELRGVKGNCDRVQAMFSKVFREGPERGLADALVAVTGYAGYIAPKEVGLRIEAKGCAWSARTIPLTYGQGLDIVAGDRNPYVPDFIGQPLPAQIFVLPGQAPVRIAPQKPGRLTLFDAMRLYNRAEVFVLPYPTATVTNLEGRFELSGIPVGKVNVNAILPQTGGTAQTEIEVKAGEASDVSLVIHFDKNTYKPTFLAAPKAP